MGRDLPPADETGAADPFIIMRCQGKKTYRGDPIKRETRIFGNGDGIKVKGFIGEAFGCRKISNECLNYRQLKRAPFRRSL